MRVQTRIKAGGNVVTNWGLHAHTQTAGLFELAANRHKGDENIDATTTNATRAQWAAIVSAARSSMTDDEFRATVASVWPGWAATHCAGTLAGEYRGHVLSVVDP